MLSDLKVVVVVVELCFFSFFFFWFALPGVCSRIPTLTPPTVSGPETASCNSLSKAIVSAADCLAPLTLTCCAPSNYSSFFSSVHDGYPS